MEILKYCTDCDEIQFKEDGSWAPMRSKKEVQEVTTSYNGVDGKSCFGTYRLPVRPLSSALVGIPLTLIQGAYFCTFFVAFDKHLWERLLE